MTSLSEKDTGWAWVVLGACGSCVMLTSGLAVLAGMFQTVFLYEFDSGVVITSWITSLYSSLMQLLGPITGLVCTVFGCRTSVMCGSLLLTGGLLLSSFCGHWSTLLLAFGVSSGLGLGLIYSAAVVRVNLSFDRFRPLASAAVMAAGGLGVMVTPPLCRHLLEVCTWRETLSVFAGLSAQLLVAGALLFPPGPNGRSVRSGRWISSCLNKKSPSKPSKADNITASLHLSHTDHADHTGNSESNQLSGKSHGQNCYEKPEDSEQTKPRCQNESALHHRHLKTRSEQDAIDLLIEGNADGMDSQTFGCQHASTHQGLLDVAKSAAETATADIPGPKHSSQIVLEGCPGALRMPSGEIRHATASSREVRDKSMPEIETGVCPASESKPAGDTDFMTGYHHASQVPQVGGEHDCLHHMPAKSLPGSVLCAQTVVPTSGQAAIATAVDRQLPRKDGDDDGDAGEGDALLTNHEAVLPPRRTVNRPQYPQRDARNVSVLSHSPRSSKNAQNATESDDEEARTPGACAPDSLAHPQSFGAAKGVDDDDDEISREAGSSEAPLQRTCREVFTNPALLLLCAFLFLVNAAIGIVLVHYPSFCLQRGSTLDVVSLAFSVNGLAMTCSRFLLGALMQDRRIDALAVFVGMALVTTLLILVTPVMATTSHLQVLVMALLGIYSGGAYAMLTEITIHCAGVATLSLAFGVEMIAAGLGWLVAPPVAGWLVVVTGSYDTAIFLSGVLHCIAAAASMAVAVSRPKWNALALVDQERERDKLNSSKDRDEAEGTVT